MVQQTAITLHPQVLYYRLAIAQLQYQLRELLSEWLTLTLDHRPALLSRYREVFGVLEQVLQDVTLKASVGQRVCEIVRLTTQRGHSVTEQVLRRIFQLVASQYRMYHEQSPSMQRARSKTQAYAVVHERNLARECCHFYRELVKRLHPDRDGDEELFERYWNVVQEAYANGDIQRLRAIHTVMCIDRQYRSDETYSLQQLIQMHRRLLYRVDYERRRIERLQNEEPFVFIQCLDNPSWIARRRRELENLIGRQQRLIELCNAELQRYTSKSWEEFLYPPENEGYNEQLFDVQFFKHTSFTVRG